jgi:hypothetical protein
MLPSFCLDLIHRASIATVLAIVITGASSPAQTVAKPQDTQDLYLMAVGDIPVPVLKVVTKDGFTGYQPEELPAEVVFPQTWRFAAAKASTELTITLNRGALKLAMPPEPGPINLRPPNCPGKAPGANRTITLPRDHKRHLIVIYNRASKIDWMRHYDFVVTSLETSQTGRPAAKIINLSGIDLLYLDSSGKETALPSGAAAVGYAQIHQETRITSLPLIARKGEQRFDLRLTPLDITGELLPIIAIYPAHLQNTPNAMPFKTSVLLPHTAISLPLREGTE